MQIDQHVVEWWENLLPDAATCTAAGSWFSHHSTITLLTCKYLYRLPVGLIINTCTCLYTLFVFLEGSKTNPGMKQPHTPILASMLRKGAGGGGGGRGGGKGGGGGG